MERLYQVGMISDKLTFAKETASIPCTIGVQQGDNVVSPMIFLYTMQAQSQTIEYKWNTHQRSSTDTSKVPENDVWQITLTQDKHRKNPVGPLLPALH